MSNRTIQLTQSLKSEAAKLGFTLSGACPAVTPIGFHSFSQWLDAGEMHYLSERKSAYHHPRNVMDGVSSLLMLGMNYLTTTPDNQQLPGSGRIARYAWGTSDYHDLVHARLKRLKKFAMSVVEDLYPDRAIKVRGVVDTAPLLEREFAQLAGIGWSAKNTMMINRQQGSWFFLAALLINVELEYDEPFSTNHCGTCTACLDACPTDAFPKPGVLDATKCISYLTIEHRSAIPIEMREQIGDWILGCDICQEVCPWNRKAPMSEEPAFKPIDGHNPLQLRELFSIDDDEFRARFRKTPLWRPKRRGILRNAAIVLGNRPHEDNIPALALGLKDIEPLIRGASAWALGRHGKSLSAKRAVTQNLLGNQLEIESDSNIRWEIENAIDSVC